MSATEELKAQARVFARAQQRVELTTLLSNPLQRPAGWVIPIAGRPDHRSPVAHDGRRVAGAAGRRRVLPARRRPGVRGVAAHRSDPGTPRVPARPVPLAGPARRRRRRRRLRRPGQKAPVDPALGVGQPARPRTRCRAAAPDHRRHRTPRPVAGRRQPTSRPLLPTPRLPAGPPRTPRPPDAARPLQRRAGERSSGGPTA